jgi:Tfp pilus assembly protein PilE
MFKTMIVAVVGALALITGYQAYSGWTTHNATDARLMELQNQIESLKAAEESRIAEITTQLDGVQTRIGMTATEIDDAQKAAVAARKEQQRAEVALRQSLDENAKRVESLREQSAAGLAAGLQEVRQETTSQFSQVNGQVTTVKGDLETTRTDLAASRREINDVRDSLGRQIAHNAEELSVLKRRGERDYYEFDITKAKDMSRVAGIRIQLNKADPKARKYDLTLQVDDNKLQKKGQLLNEPINLSVGKDRIRYELVVNSIDKDRIRGYISTPKDTVSSNSLAFQD